jgi:hypothetical protein
MLKYSLPGVRFALLRKVGEPGPPGWLQEREILLPQDQRAMLLADTLPAFQKNPPTYSPGPEPSS